MEETKKCPYCGEEILATAKKCKHCGEWLDKTNKESTPTKSTSNVKWMVIGGVVAVAVVALIFALSGKFNNSEPTPKPSAANVQPAQTTNQDDAEATTEASDQDIEANDDPDAEFGLQITHPGMTYLNCTVKDKDGYTNVREGPGTQYNIATTMDDGEGTFAKEIPGDWWPIYTDVPGELLGYIHKSRLVVNDTFVAPNE